MNPIQGVPAASGTRTKPKKDTSALLRQCAREGEVRALGVALQIDRGIVTNTDADGNTILHHAIHNRVDMRVVRLLLDFGANPAHANNNGDTCFHLAFALRPPVMALTECLVEPATWQCVGNKGLALGGPNAQGKVACELLHEADDGTIAGYRRVILAFQDRYEEWLSTFLKHVFTSIGAADRDAVYRILNESRIAPHRPLLNGNSLLCLAAAGGTAYAVVAILQHAKHEALLEIALESTNDEGQTPLMAAAAAGNVGVIGPLLGAGADIARTDRDGNTLMHYAVAGNAIALLALLMDEGCLPNCRNHRGFTPMMQAAHTSNIALVRLLQARGGDINGRDDEGLTPLMHAYLADCSPAFAREMVRRGAAMDVEDYRGKTVAVYQREHQARLAAKKSSCQIL